MSKQGSYSELFAHENDALTARPQLHSGYLLVSDSYIKTESNTPGNQVTSKIPEFFLFVS